MVVYSYKRVTEDIYVYERVIKVLLGFRYNKLCTI